jgi:hypothetical protein
VVVPAVELDDQPALAPYRVDEDAFDVDVDVGKRDAGAFAQREE